jgi:hypothetical protein
MSAAEFPFNFNPLPASRSSVETVLRQATGDKKTNNPDSSPHAIRRIGISVQLAPHLHGS